VLSRLRAALPTVPIRAESDTLARQTLPRISVDLHEFQDALRAAGPGAASEVARQQLERASAPYRGPLLDGLSVRDGEGLDEWLRLERERWQQRWLSALEQLIAVYEQVGQWVSTIEWARRAAAADPLQERFHRAHAPACPCRRSGRRAGPVPCLPRDARP
jgi:DNA-binding SARP family transcriptional activator